MFTQINLNWSDSDFITDTNYRPGGTLLATMDTWVGRILQPLVDPHKMGRWSGNAYQLGVAKRLFLFSTYRVCKQSPSLGLISSYRQHLLKLQQRVPNQLTPCPRQFFISDLVQYIQSLAVTQDDYIIILIDANEQLGEDRQGIEDMMIKLGLIDTITRHHQQQCSISTHHTIDQQAYRLHIQHRKCTATHRFLRLYKFLRWSRYGSPRVIS